MPSATDELYRIRDFAQLTGVTVRTLHHYDRLGLLKPTRRSPSGYRLYGERELIRLEQIVVLKFLGLSLDEIRKLLKGESPLIDTLRRQQALLAERRRQLDTAIQAIQRTRRSLESGATLDHALLNKIIQEIKMHEDTQWTRKYYSAETQAKLDSRQPAWSPELQEKISRQWSDLFADIAAAIAQGETPAGPKAHALATRWKELLAGFTGGDPQIQSSLNRMWADQPNWPEPQQSAYRIKPEIQAFITSALRAK